MVKEVKDSELIVVDGRMYHLRLRPDQLSENIFVVGDPGRADKVAAFFDDVEHTERNREYVTHTGTYKKMPITVIATGIGTDNNEIALVESYGLNEFDLESKVRKENCKPLTIIRLGTSGGPQRDIPAGTLAISSYALGLDNTGMFYELGHADETSKKIEEEGYRIITENTPDTSRFKGKIHPYSSKASSDVVEALIKNVRVDHVVGITASASGFFGPQGREFPGLPITVPRLQEHLATLEVDGLNLLKFEKIPDLPVEQRIVNFEMESSLLFHLGRLMNYRCGTICPIIANRQTGEFKADYGPDVDNCIETGLNAMIDLY